jgi:hypothetical protein
VKSALKTAASAVQRILATNVRICTNGNNSPRWAFAEDVLMLQLPAMIPDYLLPFANKDISSSTIHASGASITA